MPANTHDANTPSVPRGSGRSLSGNNAGGTGTAMAGKTTAAVHGNQPPDQCDRRVVCHALEQARSLLFSNGSDEACCIGSADLMKRYPASRAPVATPAEKTRSRDRHCA